MRVSHYGTRLLFLSSLRWFWCCQPDPSQHLGMAKGLVTLLHLWLNFRLIFSTSSPAREQNEQTYNAVLLCATYVGLRTGRWGSQDSLLRGTPTPKGMLDLPWIQAKEPSLCFSLQLTSGQRLRRGDSWNCPIWSPEEVLPRLWSLHFPPMTQSVPVFLICSRSTLSMLGAGPSLHNSAEKDSQPSLRWQHETTSSWHSSNAAVLFGITRRDGCRVDVLYLVFQFLMTALLYHEVYNLEGGLIQSSFTFSVATLYNLIWNN